MDRRNFLRSLLVGAVAAAVAPNIFVPKLIKPTWKSPVLPDFWTQVHRTAMMRDSQYIDVLTDSKTANIIRAAVSKYIKDNNHFYRHEIRIVESEFAPPNEIILLPDSTRPVFQDYVHFQMRA